MGNKLGIGPQPLLDEHRFDMQLAGIITLAHHDRAHEVIAFDLNNLVTIEDGDVALRRQILRQLDVQVAVGRRHQRHVPGDAL